MGCHFLVCVHVASGLLETLSMMSVAPVSRHAVGSLRDQQRSLCLQACITCVKLAPTASRRPSGPLCVILSPTFTCSPRLHAVTANALRPAQVMHSVSADDSDSQKFLPAILLAFFASQNRSLLAADCLIETVVEMYRRGIQLDSLQFTLSMATLQSGSTLLSEQELDILTARCGIIMLTLHEVGCAEYSQAQEGPNSDQHQRQEQPLSEQAKRLTRGLGQFVKQIVNMYKSGFNSRRMLLQQSLAGVQGGEPGGRGGESPSVITMQQNTRLVVLTLEMIQHSSVPTAIPLESVSPYGTNSNSYPNTQPPQDPVQGSAATSSSSSPPPTSSSSDRLPTAGASSSQVSRASERELNSSGPGEGSAQKKRKRAKPARVDQVAEEEGDAHQNQSAVPIEEAQSPRQQGEEEELRAGDTSDASATSGSADPGTSSTVPQTDIEDPTERLIPSQTPGRAHSLPNQVLSPTGYILGFLQPANPRTAAAHPAAESSSSASDPQIASPSVSAAQSADEHDPMSQDSAASRSPSLAKARGEEEDADGKAMAPAKEEEEDQISSSPHARSAAVRLLLGFMGALQASQYAVESFVTNVVHYYREGWTAQQLFDQLIQDEFAQTGGLLPLNPRIQGGRNTPPHLTAELFARWLSTSYMTLAVMGVPHPHASSQVGWAWVTLPHPHLATSSSPSSSSSSSQDSLQAHRLAELIANKLRLMEEVDYRRQGQQLEERVSESAEAMRNISAFQLMTQADLSQPQEQYVFVEDVALQQTSTGYNVLVQQLELVSLTRTALTRGKSAQMPT